MLFIEEINGAAALCWGLLAQDELYFIPGNYAQKSKREKNAVGNDCGVCVALWNIQQWLVRPARMI